MLIRYGCENFRSINEYQEILFTAASTQDQTDDTLIEPIGIRDKLLPVVAIYGGNGSGKTNLLNALRFLVEKILSSAFGTTEKAKVPKFKLAPDCKKMGSTFDIDFVANEQHYHYGFTIKNSVIAEEWLYKISYGTRKSTTTLFYRDIEDEEVFTFGKSLKGNNKNIASVTDDGTLFLSMAAKSKHPIIKEIYDYFDDFYKFRFEVELFERTIGQSIYSNKVESEISQFLSLVDVGAVCLEVEQEEFDEKQITILKTIGGMMSDVYRTLGRDEEKFTEEEFAEHLESETDYKIVLSRLNINGEAVKFSFDQESLGTRALVSFLAYAFKVLKNGGIFIVDEVESSLHTLLTLRLVELFSNQETNPKGAQLLFTTHETQLMNFKGVRRDQIWLTEKCSQGSTKVASLQEFSIDKRTNWRKGYIEGRFGAIPILGFIDNFKLLGD